MFYDRFVFLCKQKGVSPSRAAEDAGLNKSNVTKWKKDPDARPTGKVIDKLTRYFGVSVAELVGENPVFSEEGKRVITDDEIKFALFGGDGEITDEMYEEVRNFAAFVKRREMRKKE